MSMATPEPLIERSAKKSRRIKSLEITHALLSGSIAALPAKDGHMRSENIRFREADDARP